MAYAVAWNKSRFEVSREIGGTLYYNVPDGQTISSAAAVLRKPGGESLGSATTSISAQQISITVPSLLGELEENYWCEVTVTTNVKTWKDRIVFDVVKFPIPDNVVRLNDIQPYVGPYQELTGLARALGSTAAVVLQDIVDEARGEVQALFRARATRMKGIRARLSFDPNEIRRIMLHLTLKLIYEKISTMDEDAPTTQAMNMHYAKAMQCFENLNMVMDTDEDGSVDADFGQINGYFDLVRGR